MDVSGYTLANETETFRIACFAIPRPSFFVRGRQAQGPDAPGIVDRKRR